MMKTPPMPAAWGASSSHPDQKLTCANVGQTFLFACLLPSSLLDPEFFGRVRRAYFTAGRSTMLR